MHGMVVTERYGNHRERERERERKEGRRVIYVVKCVCYTIN